MNDEMGELYEQLRREYLAEAPARLGELRKDLAAVRSGEPDAVASLKARFHRLAGSGGSYGFPGITAASRESERWLADHPEPDDAGFALLGASVGRVAAAFDEAARQLGLAAVPARVPPFGWRAHLVGGATDIIARLGVALRDAQYAVSVSPLGADPAAIPVSERPDIALIVPAPEEDPAPAVARWTAGPFERRVAVALVTQPEGVDALREPYSHLDALVPPERADGEIPRWARGVARAAGTPAAVLVVVRDEADRSTIAKWLEAAGLRVIAHPDAASAEESLRIEQPDLVLVDWSLEGGAAEGLTRTIRRTPRHLLTPILAWSNAASASDRDAALEAGADDLMVGSEERRLTAEVLRRAWRSRRLNDSMRRDSLSGFLSLGALMDELESVLAYAYRGGERLAFLLLDVDHFRRVNEQLGHQTGDRVLLHISHIIRERVRQSDLVARMGGEEFGVLLRHCGPADACLVAEQIRAALVASPPIVEGTPMPVRLSAGVAGYPDHAIGTRELLLAAERALRQAKETGRDRVSQSGAPAIAPAASGPAGLPHGMPHSGLRAI